MGASRVKIGRNVQFPKRLDIYDFVTPELQQELQIGRVKESEQKDRDVERTQQALKEGKRLLFDDDKVPEKLDREVDLAGGRMDAQIAYFCLYKKAPARIFEAAAKA